MYSLLLPTSKALNVNINIFQEYAFKTVNRSLALPFKRLQTCPCA